MTQSHPKSVASRVGVILLLVSFAAASFAATPAEAQLNVYKLEGVVYGPNYQPLSGAAIALHKLDGTKQASATSDSAGKYTLASLPSGKYNLSVSHGCCRGQWIPIDVAGTDPTVQQNVVLLAGEGKGALVLKGIVKDEKSGKPLSGVQLELWNYPQPSEPEKMATSSYYPYQENHQTSVTGADGSYAFNVDAGSVSIAARLDGYDVLHTNLDMRAGRSLDLPMRSASGGIVTVSGVIKGSDGKTIPNAWISVQPDYECDESGACYAEPVESRSPSNAEGDVQFWYEPANQPYASAQTDENGKYTLKTTPGRRMIVANAENYLPNQTKFTGNDGESKTINLVLERMPADSVRVHGKVVDAQTGKPIPYASVSLENQRWGHWNHTMTKEDGSFDFNTKPGYTLVTANAEKQYWIPCEVYASDRDSIAPGEPNGSSYPCPDSGEQKRERGYYSRIMVLSTDASDRPLDLKLQPRPEPTAELKGYVVNASSKVAIPNVMVQFYNEFTHDWGSATTDSDGSYRIKVHGGYYTMRSGAEHYFEGVINVEVKDGESKRADIELTPGEKRYGYGGCCYHTMAASADSASASGGSGASAPKTMYAGGAPEPMMAETRSPDASGSGEQAYQGEGGGLGPYKPFTGSDNTGGGTAPGAGIAILVASLGIVAALRRRNH